jgi:hypothetical protein
MHTALATVLRGYGITLPYGDSLIVPDYVSGWTANAVTLTAAATPSIARGHRATTMTETATTADHYLNAVWTKGATAIAYEYIVAAAIMPNTSKRWLSNSMFDGGFGAGVFANVDLVTGTLDTSGAFGAFTSVSNTLALVGGRWWVLSMKFTTPASANLLLNTGVRDATNTSSYAGTAGTGLQLVGGILRLT